MTYYPITHPSWCPCPACANKRTVLPWKRVVFYADDEVRVDEYERTTIMLRLWARRTSEMVSNDHPDWKWETPSITGQPMYFATLWGALHCAVTNYERPW